MFKKIKRWYYRRKVIQVINMLKTIDTVMIKGGYDRATRRRFWKAMHSDRGEVLRVLDDAVLSTKMGPSDGGGGLQVGRAAPVD